MKNHILHTGLLVSSVLVNIQAQIDATFGLSGKLSIPAPIHTSYKLSKVKTDVEGALYVYATQYGNTGSDVVLQRLLSNGARDLSYGVNGYSKVDINEADDAVELLQLPHRKTMLVGYTVVPNGARKPFLAKLTEKGLPEGQPVVVAHSSIPNDVVITSAVLTSRAQYLLAGHATNPNNGSKDFILLLIDKQGQLVPSFGLGGWVFVDFVGATDIAQHVLIRENGSILVTGYSQKNAKEQYAMASLTAGGQLITAFGASGKLNVGVGATGLDRAFEAYEYGNKILVAGYSKAGTRDVVSLVQIASHTGQLDKQFDYDGRRLLYIAGKNDRAFGVTGTQDGALYISGLSQQYDNVYHPIVVKLHSDGSADASFGTAGVLRIANSVVEESSQHSMVIQSNTKPVVAHTGLPGQGLLLARMVEAKANLAGFTATALDPVCEGGVKLNPQHSEGTHQWIFEEPYGPFNTSEASPSVKFWKAGFHKVKHIQTVGSVQHTIAQVLFVDKVPAAYTNQYDIVPYAWSTTMYGHSERNFYPSEGNTFTYEWEHMGQTYGNVGSIQQTYAQAGFYPLTFTVTREATYEDQCPIATAQDTIIVTEARQNCNDGDEDLGPSVLHNLVVNGDFENTTCPATTFRSDFQQQCQAVSGVNPEHIAIVTSVNGSKALRQVEKAYDFNPFLLIGRYTHVLNRDLWAQEVQVRSGQVYQFYAKVFNYSYEVEGDYTFPKLTFAVDDAPVLTIELVGGVRHMCCTYKADHTGIVTLRVLKSNGVYFSDGTVELDDIVFGPALNEAMVRKSVGSNEYEAGVTIAPNPATSLLYVHAEGSVASHIALFNGLGALVKRQHFSAEGTVTLSGVERGIYVAHIYNEEGRLLKSEKLVVEK